MFAWSSNELQMKWLNSSPLSDAYMHQWIGSTLVQIMACCLLGTKPLSKPMLGYYTPRFNEVERGVYWFHLVLLSICPQNRVCSVSSTILIGSISYLHILSSNFRRCVACNVCFKIWKFWNFGEFLKFVTLTLSSFDLGSNMTQMTQWYG